MSSHKVIDLRLVGLPDKHMLVDAANLARKNGAHDSEETGAKWKLHFLLYVIEQGSICQIFCLYSLGIG